MRSDAAGESGDARIHEANGKLITDWLGDHGPVAVKDDEAGAVVCTNIGSFRMMAGRVQMELQKKRLINSRQKTANFAFDVFSLHD